MLETIGLVIFSLLFVYSGYKHIKNHTAMSGYTASVFGACPLAKYFGFLGGAPTGVFLVAAGVGAAFGEPVALYALAGFLVAATVLFHRETLGDPGTQKGIALIGAALALAVLV